MERFFSALSLTLLLTGLVTIAQVQSSSDPVDPVVEVDGMTRLADETLSEDETISRAELAEILVRTFELHKRYPVRWTSIPVRDVSSSHWAYQDIQLVLRNGIMTGYGEGRFYPEQRVTRAEAFAIFAQAYGVFQFSDQTIDRVLAPYPDATKIPDWARKSVATAVHEGFVNLKLYNRIDPLSPMTRRDLAYAIQSYLSRQQPSQSPSQQPSHSPPQRSRWQALRP